MLARPSGSGLRATGCFERGTHVPAHSSDAVYKFSVFRNFSCIWKEHDDINPRNSFSQSLGVKSIMNNTLIVTKMTLKEKTCCFHSCFSSLCFTTD